MNQQSHTDHVINTRIETLSSIKEKLIEITNGRSFLPVYLNNVMITNQEKYTRGSAKYYKLHSIFYGADMKLYGDLLCANSHWKDREIMFGKLIEEFEIDDLLDILANLKYNKWKILDDNNSQKIERNSGLISIKKIFKRFNRQLGIRNA